METVDREEPTASAPQPLDERIIAELAGADGLMPFADLRTRVRTATLYERLAALATAGRVVKTDTGYRLADR